MDFRQISCFMQIAKCKNFTTAASQLYISQPAISRHIANMEMELGVTLFQRDRRSVELTPAGKIMEESFSKILAEYEKAAEKARLSEEGRKEDLRLGIAVYIPFYSLPASIVKHLSNANNRSVTTEYTTHADLNEGLRSGKYDVIVTLKKAVEQHSDIEYKEIRDSQISMIYSADLVKGKEDRGIRALDGMDFYIPHEDTLPGAEGDLRAVFEEFGIEAASVRTVPNDTTLIFMAESGQGVIMLEEMAQYFLRDSNMARLPINIYHTIVVAHMKGDESKGVTSMMKLLDHLKVHQED